MGRESCFFLRGLSSWCLVIVVWLFHAAPWGLPAVCDCGISWSYSLTIFVEAVERFILSKMTITNYSVPWIDVTIKRLRARKSNDNDVKIHYKRFRAHVQKLMRDACWKCVSDIFTFENDSSDPDTPEPERFKSFGHLPNHFKKTPRFGSHHSENTEFFGQKQRKNPTFVIGNSNQLLACTL